MIWTMFDEPHEDVLFVDPGLEGTGWAFAPRVPIGRGCDARALVTTSGVLRPPRNERWENQCWSLAAELAGVIKALSAKAVVLEFPVLFSGHATSQASAAKGDLFKLTYLIGGYGQEARRLTGNIPLLVTPMEWKGQLPKDAVMARIVKALGREFRDHEGDAVGMALSACGEGRL